MAHPLAHPLLAAAEIGAALVDLVLPTECAGCGSRGRSWCTPCAVSLASAVPAGVRPSPSPDGLPGIVALADYAGPLRGAVLAYKERGRHRLAALLGDRLADVVASAVPSGPVLLVPVPATAEATRRRHGDHMGRLAVAAAAALRRSGRRAAVANPLRARPRVDSAGLSASERLAVADSSFDTYPAGIPAVRAAVAAGVRVVLVDDVLTTGATLAAVTRALDRAGVPVHAAAVLAATRRKSHRP